MRDLAPDVVRQRLLIEATYDREVDIAAIEEYFRRITDDLGLRAYGNPIIFSPAGMGKESNQGYDALVPLIDSGISLYVWTARRFLSVVLFTCKAFDVDIARGTTREFFNVTELESAEF